MINWTAALNRIRTELSDTWSSLSGAWLPALIEKEIKTLEEVAVSSRIHDDSYYLWEPQSAILTGGIATGKTHTITVGGGSGSSMSNGGSGGVGLVSYGMLTGAGFTGGSSSNLTKSNFSVNGDAIISGELIVNGVSLTERLDTIEKRLAILNVNLKLEDKWKELKTLGDRYRELEKDILEKEEIWNIIKK